jgi:hypothetical protein
MFRSRPDIEKSNFYQQLEQQKQATSYELTQHEIQTCDELIHNFLKLDNIQENQNITILQKKDFVSDF